MLMERDRHSKNECEQKYQNNRVPSVPLSVQVALRAWERVTEPPEDFIGGTRYPQKALL